MLRIFPWREIPLANEMLMVLFSCTPHHLEIAEIARDTVKHTAEEKVKGALYP